MRPVARNLEERSGWRDSAVVEGVALMRQKGVFSAERDALIESPLTMIEAEKSGICSGAFAHGLLREGEPHALRFVEPHACAEVWAKERGRHDAGGGLACVIGRSLSLRLEFGRRRRAHGLGLGGLRGAGSVRSGRRILGASGRKDRCKDGGEEKAFHVGG